MGQKKSAINSAGSIKQASGDEFNNLFTTMLGICTLLEEKSRNDKDIARYVSLLRGTVERANSLIVRKGANV